MERKNYIDFMKGIAIIGVIVIHIATERLGDYSNTSELVVYELFYAMARFSVPFFFMVTGYLMLDTKKDLSVKKIYFKYILRVIVAAFVYGLFYKILRVLLDNSYHGIGSFIKSYLLDFVTGNLEFHFWYVFAIIGVYITLPVLRAFIKSADRRLIEYFLLVWVIVNVLLVLSKSGYIPFVKNVLDQFYFVGMFVEYLGYPVLGYYLLNYDFSKKIKNIVVSAGFVSILVALSFTIYDVLTYGKIRVEYLAYCGPFVLIFSAGLCLLFKDREISYTRFIPRAICKLGQNTLNIYFIHMIFVIIIFQYGILEYHFFPIIDMIVYTIVVLMASVLFVFVLNRILRIRKRM